MDTARNRFAGAVGMGLGAAALLMSLAGPAAGQSAGALSGSVTDQSGAPLAGVTITIVIPATAVVQTAITNQYGDFVSPQVPPGSYTVTVELSGFKKAGQS